MVVAASWSEEIRQLYLSGAANQFILHGNVEDRLLLPAPASLEGESPVPSLGNVYDFLREHQLRKFDLVFTYDLGRGLQAHAQSPLGKLAFESWPSAREAHAFPKSPRDGIAYIDHFLRYAQNLRLLAEAEESDLPAKLKGASPNIGVIIRTASLVLPLRATLSSNHEVHSAAYLVRSWSVDSPYRELHLATFLIAEKLNDLHPLLSGNPRAATLAIPLPSESDLASALEQLAQSYPEALQHFGADFQRPASRLTGTTLSSVESLVKVHHHRENPITEETLAQLKKELVEKDCQGLIEFIEPDRTLDAVHGNEGIKTWLRQDIALWKQDDLQAMPMGYLFCGPVGTGKTYIVECLAGDAGVPVVKFKNFRDRWVGSTEGNLERIFAFLHALGRCIVFIDEADQALGSRGGNQGDSGVSGRVYSMMAKEMSNTRNRGKILWILASSRPDLIEVDLKRPGRIDVKIPLFPSINSHEAYDLIRALCQKQGVSLPKGEADAWGELLPDHLTAGAAEAIAVKVYRLMKAASLSEAEALSQILSDYQSPIPPEVMEFQMDLAIREASDLSFIPDVFRK